MDKDIDVLVLGSLNMDLIIETDRNPYPGETIRGKAFYTSPGGKGDNQAVAIGRLGGNVSFMGCVGKDEYGRQLIANLIDNHVNTGGIAELDGVSTGLAFINVFKGQNTIILYAGANGQCTIDQMKHYEGMIKRARILLMQLEIPLETVVWAASVAKKSDTMVVLNPAPAVTLDDEFYRDIDVLVPNELEAQQLLDMEVKRRSDYDKMVTMLTDMGVKNAIITLGSKGMIYNSGSGIKHKPAYEVKAVDSTGAGDAFIGGLCHALAQGMDMDRATDYANAVAAISVTRIGAQSASPTAKEVEEFLAKYTK